MIWLRYKGLLLFLELHSKTALQHSPELKKMASYSLRSQINLRRGNLHAFIKWMHKLDP